MGCSDKTPGEAHQHGAATATDCSEVLDRMFVFLDNELDQAGYAEIQQHLEECGPCLVKYNLERTVKMLVARSCQETAPADLRQRVMLSIRQVQIRIEEV
jgi:mycothiol system anti-sigma-R factor